MTMTRRALWIVFLAVISSAGIAAAAPQDSAQDKDRAAIAKAVQNYMDSWNSHDVHAVGMSYAEDCDFVNNFRGRDARPSGNGGNVRAVHDRRLQPNESDGESALDPVLEVRCSRSGRGLGDDRREKPGWHFEANAQGDSQSGDDERKRREMAHYHHARARVHEFASDHEPRTDGAACLAASRAVARIVGSRRLRGNN